MTIVVRRPVHWPQDAIRRAATAMRESGSNDWIVLARTALENALRHQIDLAALLADTTRKAADGSPDAPAETSSQ